MSAGTITNIFFWESNGALVGCSTCVGVGICLSIFFQSMTGIFTIRVLLLQFFHAWILHNCGAQISLDETLLTAELLKYFLHEACVGWSSSISAIETCFFLDVAHHIGNIADQGVQTNSEDLFATQNAFYCTEWPFHLKREKPTPNGTEWRKFN